MLLVDGFIKNQKIIDEIKKEHHWSNIPKYNWWDGWWKVKPRNIWEQTIEIIWKQFLNPRDEICGFEYWATKLTDNGLCKWHHDKDEKLVRTEKKMISPTIGHIYYAEIKNLKGGFLEIAPDQNIDKGQFKKIYTYDEHTERYMPLENRLIIFDPSRLHGVSKIHKGIRKAFLANGWKKKPSTFDAGENVNGSFELVDWKEKNQLFNI
tara:strand:+ start:154 stop:777 length:624 start_codon:yes stop_codon:yes gene_type:complete